MFFRAMHQYKLELIDINDIESVYEPYVDALLGIVFYKELLSLSETPYFPIITFNSPMIAYNIHIKHYW